MRLFFFFLYALNVLSIKAQTNPTLWCHELNSAEGLTSQVYNRHTYCDSDGYVWVSSTKGLNRFNGRNVKQYQSNFQDSTLLYGQNIQSDFFEDKHTNIWFCTYEAIHRYNRQKDQFDHFFIKDTTGEKLDEDYKLFLLERDSFLWVKISNSIYKVDISDEKLLEQSFERLSPIGNTEYYHINTGVSKTGQLKYIFACKGTRKKGMEIFKIKDGKVLSRSQDVFTSFSSTPAVFQVFFEDDQNIWLSTNQGIIKWNINNNSTETVLPNINTVSFIVPYDKDNLLISARNLGLFLYHKKSRELQKYDLRKIGDAKVKYDNNIRNIHLDKNKVLWISKPDNGLLYTHLEKSKFKSIVREETGNYLILSQYNNQVILTNDKSIKILNSIGKEVSNISTEDLPHIHHAIPIDKERLLLATRKGLYVFDIEQKTFKLIPNSKSHDFLYLYKLNNNKILASSLIQGIFEIEEKEENWVVKNSYKSNEGFVGYTTIYQDALNQIYICKNETSLCVFEYDKEKLILKDNLLIRGSVYCFYEETNNNTIWIGTSYGLVNLNKTNFKDAQVLYTTSNGLPDNNILSIIPAPTDKLWLSSSKGLSLMDKQQEIFKNFSLADGMLSTQFKNYSGLKLQDGTIWFGGNNGITSILPTAIEYIESSPKIIITDIKVDDLTPKSIICEESKSENLNEISSLKYTYQENTLSFSFLATDYSDPLNTTLSYKLEGFDENWVNVEKEKSGFARYSNLPSGEYILQIKGENSDNEVMQPALRSLGIIITPPYWEETWFRVLVGLTLIFLIGYFIFRRIKTIEEKAQLNTRIVENKMSALAAQMSPHFIFNSLNSVNRFILNQNRQKASEYLGRFSKLIRMMLENSRNSEHSIAKELEFLQLYMKVEAQRFKIPFEFTINIDKNIDKYDSVIPTMILQPFVENAIWHGISNKTGKGKIMVAIDEQDGVLKCIIEDDGVGRIKAKELSFKKDHKSRALEIMEERLELLFPEQKHLCKIVYIDLEDAKTNIPCGTRVEITLPIEQ